MDQNQPNEDKKGHTWELFQARPMNRNIPDGNQKHVYAAPPPTVLHISKCGVEVPVPSPLDWRD